MKKNMKKLGSLLTAATLTLSLLTGCGSGIAAENEVPLADSPVHEAMTLAGETTAAGRLLLSVNPEIELEYDDGGLVVEIEGRNDDGREIAARLEEGYIGRDCGETVAELIRAIAEAGYFDDTSMGEKNIVLQLDRGSKLPEAEFLNLLAADVEKIVAELKLGSRPVTIDEDDYDDRYEDKNYIAAAKAEELAAVQSGAAAPVIVEKEYDIDDGVYEIELIRDGVEYEYEVSATTGKILSVEIDDNDRDDLYGDDLYDDDRYDDDWDDRDDDHDDLYDDDRYDDDWDDRNDDRDDLYDDDRYDDDWDDHDDDRDDLDDDDDEWDD